MSGIATCQWRAGPDIYLEAAINESTQNCASGTDDGAVYIEMIRLTSQDQIRILFTLPKSMLKSVLHPVEISERSSLFDGGQYLRHSARISELFALRNEMKSGKIAVKSRCPQITLGKFSVYHKDIVLQDSRIRGMSKRKMRLLLFRFKPHRGSMQHIQYSSRNS